MAEAAPAVASAPPVLPPMSPLEKTSIPPPAANPSEFRALAVLVGLLGLVATATVLHFLAPVIVAAWFAGLTAGVRGRLVARIGGRHRVAAMATAALVVVIVAPLVLLAVPLAGMVLEFARGLSHGNLNEAVTRVTTSVSGAATGHGARGAGSGLLRRILHSGESFISGAASFMSETVATLSIVIAQLFLLAVCSYYFSAEGGRMLLVIERASPLSPPHFARLREEFMAVARAMLVGELLTAAVQGAVAGVIYFALGIPSALVLTLLTAVGALVPTVGSAIVWVPVAVSLGVTGRTRDAVILAVLGVTVIATVDNVLRPVFSRMGAGKMHPLLLFLGIFGGLEAFGGWGIILGPVVLALFVAAFRLYASEASARRHPAEG
jgi:predicted PurR-regulated permease PerM